MSLLQSSKSSSDSPLPVRLASSAEAWARGAALSPLGRDSEDLVKAKGVTTTVSITLTRPHKTVHPTGRNGSVNVLMPFLS
jgi:hypothetical protein